MLKAHERFAIHLLHQSGHSIRKISHITGHDRESIRSVLCERDLSIASGTKAKHVAASTYAWFSEDPNVSMRDRHGRRSLLEPFRAHLIATLSKGTVCAASLLDELRQQGYVGSKRTLQRFLRVRRAKMLTKREQDNEWMRMILQGAIDCRQAKNVLKNRLSDADVDLLLQYVLTKSLKLRSRATAILAYAKGITPGPIAMFLCLSRHTVTRTPLA